MGVRERCSLINLDESDFVGGVQQFLSFMGFGEDFPDRFGRRPRS